ncbi:hypothetical protein QTO34_016953 [Cnephaeus nilssonii]|uniref:L1 transposable element RRM domain-containing protein n=1 Tax=Cnephaeus nilssonii TaxID=3371016 RepID=A0AA40LQ84_CNENI|nr:hypothetical protein QTO34_016953 [Eptesicus nilssonii]
MTENFPYLVKEIDLQVQEAHRTPNKRNPKRTTPRHIIIKMPRAKDKERILQAAREKQLVTYKGARIRLSADFSTETMQARQEWQEIFKVMNSKNLQPRLLYPAKLSFRIEGQIKSFKDKKKLKEFITTKPVLYEKLKVLEPHYGLPPQREAHATRHRWVAWTSLFGAIAESRLPCQPVVWASLCGTIMGRWRGSLTNHIAPALAGLVQWSLEHATGTRVKSPPTHVCLKITQDPDLAGPTPLG